MFKLNKEKFIKTVNEKWTNKACQMCGKNNWNLDGAIVTPMCVDEERNIQLSGKFMPMVAMTCMNCGNIVFVNPMAIDAMEDSDDLAEE